MITLFMTFRETDMLKNRHSGCRPLFHPAGGVTEQFDDVRALAIKHPSQTTKEDGFVQAKSSTKIMAAGRKDGFKRSTVEHYDTAQTANMDMEMQADLKNMWRRENINQQKENIYIF